jgi:hypothetical protein
LKRDRANGIKWDLVDHLLSNFMEGGFEGLQEYSEEDLKYAREQARRVAKFLGVSEHVYL